MKRFLLGLMEHIFLLGILIGSLLVLFGNQLTAHIARTSTKNQVVKKVSEKELKNVEIQTEADKDCQIFVDQIAYYH